MRLLALRDLERQIQAQRQKVDDDQRRLERAVHDLPGRVLRAVASPPGLLASFALGAAAAGLPRSQGVGALVLWELIRRVPLDALPVVGDLLRELRGSPPAPRDPIAGG